MKKNNELIGKYKNQRCFIIGNGPSLKNMDLSSLESEYTFGVNNIMLTELYEKIKPDFYVAIDSNFFDKNNKYFESNLKSLINKENKPLCFFPLSKRFAVKEMDLEDSLDVRYLNYWGKYIGNIMGDIQIDKYIPYARNVVNIAVFLALSMGFKEIYLLGVDMTGIVHIHEEGEVHDGGHFFEKSSELKQYESEKFKTISNEFMLNMYYDIFKSFRYAQRYAKAHGVKVVNLSQSSALDVFEFGNISNISK